MKKVVASSSLKPQGRANYKAANINDRNEKTAWVEGVKGYGIGQWVMYQGLSEDIQITSINILNGYVKSDKAWRENARVKYLKVYCNNKPICIFELKNSRSIQSFDVKDLLDNYLVKRFWMYSLVQSIKTLPSRRYISMVGKNGGFDY